MADDQTSAAPGSGVAPAPPQTSVGGLVLRAPSLQTFRLADLAQFTREGVYSNNASADVHLFYAGRDDVHGVLAHLLARVQVSIFLNMFGFDDAALNAILMAKAQDPAITMLVTLDKSQAGGKAERLLLDADRKALATFNTHFVIGESATHQISHTKGAVLDGKVAFEGSTNWSVSRRGHRFVAGRRPGPAASATAPRTTRWPPSSTPTPSAASSPS